MRILNISKVWEKRILFGIAKMYELNRNAETHTTGLEGKLVDTELSFFILHIRKQRQEKLNGLSKYRWNMSKTVSLSVGKQNPQGLVFQKIPPTILDKLNVEM